MNSLSAHQQTRLVLALTGLVQGFVYFLAHEIWPDDPTARAAIVALVFFVSVAAPTIHLSWTGADIKRLAALTAALAAVFALLALWVWLQIPGEDAPYMFDDSRVPTLIMGTVVATYALLPFLQVYQKTGQRAYPYPELFRHAWNNFFILAIGGILTGAFWLIILLWSELFKLIDVTFFEDVFTSAPFVAMSLTTVFGYGVAVGRESGRVTNTLRGITLAVFRTLMPLLAGIALLFLVSLPFTGLQPLWDTGHASAVLLSLIGLTILFLNGVYEDGTGAPPYNRWVRLGVESALLGMPIYAAITYYALGLRIEQYGLTQERFFAAVITAVAFLCAVGYAIAVLRRRGEWMETLRRFNMATAWIIATLAILLHTPLLDPLRWSARNQFNRLANEQVSAAEFDYGFLRYRLGHVGWERLAALEQLTDHPEAAAIREGVAVARAAESYRELRSRPTVLLAADEVEVLGEAELSEDFLAFVASDITRSQTNECKENRDCVMVAAALDDDAEDEFVLVLSGETDFDLLAYDRNAQGAWEQIGRLLRIGDDRNLPARGQFLDSLRALGAQPLDVPYRDLQIGAVRLRLRQ